MNKRVASTAIASAVGASLVFGLAACGKDTPPDDFKKACDSAKGQTMREDEFDNLGMAPMTFVVKGGGSKSSGGSKSKSGGGKSKPKNKSPKTSKKNNGWKVAGGNGHSKPKKSKKSKHEDNEWICARNGVELFEEEN